LQVPCQIFKDSKENQNVVTLPSQQISDSPYSIKKPNKTLLDQ